MQAKMDNIDSYIALFPKDTQKLLKQLRQLISKAAPQAEEAISYAIPTFRLSGNLVHFAGYKHHIGFYPGASGIKNFEQDLSCYKYSKGGVQFPLDKPLPATLITRIVKFRVQQNTGKATLKKSLRTCPQGHKYYKTSNCPVCPICESAKKPQEGLAIKVKIQK